MQRTVIHSDRSDRIRRHWPAAWTGRLEVRDLGWVARCEVCEETRQTTCETAAEFSGAPQNTASVADKNAVARGAIS